MKRVFLVVLLVFGFNARAAHILRDRLGCEQHLIHLSEKRMALFELLEAATDLVVNADQRQQDALVGHFGSIEAIDYALDVLAVEVVNQESRYGESTLDLPIRVVSACRVVFTLTRPPRN